MTRTYLAILLIAAACGGSNGTKSTDGGSGSGSDAGPPIDAPIDSPPSQGNHSHYVVDRVLVPTSSSQANMYGLDLDGNGSVDNLIGQDLATIAGMGANVQGGVDTAVNTGQILMLADIQTTAFDNATDAGFTLYAGTNPMPAPCSSPTDTTCRHHLDGTGTFDVAAMPRDPALSGSFVSGTYTGGPGHLPIQISVEGANLSLDLIGARVKVMATSTNITSAILAGGVTVTDRDTKIYPALSTAFNAQIATDCTALTSPPGCGCASGSTGATLISLFDSNHDCSVSVDEIKNNALVGALFAPDVTLEGQKCLSVGVSVTAVPATFTP